MLLEKCKVLSLKLDRTRGSLRPFALERWRPQKVDLSASFNPLYASALLMPVSLKGPFAARRVKGLFTMFLLKAGLIDIRLFSEGNQPNGFKASLGRDMGTGGL